MREYDFAIKLVKEAGTRLLEARAGALKVMHKGGDERDVVTSADIAINQFLIGEIRSTFPKHRISSEEGGEGAEAGEEEWLLDPVDGSANFSRGIPHFAVSIALLRAETCIVAAIYNPVTNELFSFEKGRAAFFNDKLLAVSHITEPSKAQGILVVGHQASLWDWGAKVYREFLEHFKKLKALGSSSLDLCFVAAGRADVVVYGTFTARDSAGAVAIVRAAGGEIYSLQTGKPLDLISEKQTIVAVSNATLFERIKPYLHTELLPKR